MLKLLLTLKICCSIVLLASVAAASDNSVVADKPFSVHCPAFQKSQLYRAPVKRIKANPGNWIQRIDEAAAGDEILLDDGTYEYDDAAVVIDKPLTIRGNAKSPGSVIIQGKGYRADTNGLSVMANDVHIADLTIRDVRNHAISVEENSANTIIYNVRLIDIGTQHIKGNQPGRNGLIACSDIGYTGPISTGDYNSGIDLHGAVQWTIRDNNIFNIFGDGSGCIVDTKCGTQPPGGGAAILLWQGSSDNSIIRNTITESYRGILLSLNTNYSGGNVSNNFIFRSQTGKQGVSRFIEADAGISLVGVDDVLLEGNTVILAGKYRGVIEIWKSTGNIIKNNMISKPVWNRGDASFNNCKTKSSKADCDTPEFGNVVVDNLVQLAGNIATPSPQQATNVVAQEPLQSASVQSDGQIAASSVDTSAAVEITPLEQEQQAITVFPAIPAGTGDTNSTATGTGTVDAAQFDLERRAAEVRRREQQDR